MRKVVLLHNPCAGRAQQHAATPGRVTAKLRERGYLVECVATTGPGTAGAQATAAADTADLIFACGGDGTVHEVLQGLVRHPTVTLGIVPLGSANVLARHLNLSLDPVQAAVQQLSRKAALIPLGKVQYTHAEGSRTRFFSVAGAGADGTLTYRMLARRKQRLGRLAYYLRAAQLVLRSRFSPFPLSYVEVGQELAVDTLAVSAMAVRVGSLGGVFRPMARGAEVHQTHLSLTAVLPPARSTFPVWFAMSWAHLERWNPRQRAVNVASFTCGEGLTYPVQVQADGEWLGRTPMTVSLVPDVRRILMPTSPTSRPAQRSPAS